MVPTSFQYPSNLYAIFLATPITRENVTKDAVISAVLRRGTNNIKSQELISQELESMYGASFDCGIEKTGDKKAAPRGCLHIKTMERTPFGTRCYPFLLWINFSSCIHYTKKL